MAQTSSLFLCVAFLSNPSNGGLLSFHTQINITRPQKTATHERQTWEREWMTQKSIFLTVREAADTHVSTYVTKTGVCVSWGIHWHTVYTYHHSFLPTTQYQVLLQTGTFLTPTFVASLHRRLSVWHLKLKCGNVRHPLVHGPIGKAWE